VESRFKACSRCKETKLKSEFYRKKDRKSGLDFCCKTCRRKINKQYYQENREQVSDYKKKYYQHNREYILGYKKQFYQENHGEVKRQRSNYYQKNRAYFFAKAARRKALKREAIPEVLLGCQEEKIV